MNSSIRNITLTALCGTALTACASGYDRYGYYDAPEVPVTRAATTPYTAAAYDRYDRYDRYDDVSPYEARNVPDSYRGLAGARYAHRNFDDLTAERFDGNCEPVGTVAYGDTVSDIAEYCDTTVNAILAANPSIYDPRNLRVGQQIRIPNVRGTVYEGRGYYRAPTPRVAAVAQPVAQAPQTYRAPTTYTPTERLIDRTPVAPTTNIVSRPTPARSAPVVIYINSDRSPVSSEGTAVITVDTDRPRTVARETIRSVPTTDYRFVSGTGHLSSPLGTVPAGSTVRYRTSLPQDTDYSDLGTACMSQHPDGAKIYSVSTSLSGPDCGTDRPVRLYRSASIPQ